MAMKLPARDRVPVRRAVLGAELLPLVDLDQLRQLGEHVLLVAAQVHRRRRAPERLDADDAVLGPMVGGDLRPQVADQRLELVDPVLHRRAGQEQHPLATRPRSG